MVKFLFGVLIGILVCFLFVYFGGGKAVKKAGETLIDTGAKMEMMEDTIRKGKEGLLPGTKKKPKEDKEVPKRSQ